MPPQQMDFEARRQEARRLAREIILAELGARGQRGTETREQGGAAANTTNADWLLAKFEKQLRKDLGGMQRPAAQQDWNTQYGNPNDSVNGQLDSVAKWAVRSLRWLFREQEQQAGPSAFQAGSSAFNEYNKLSKEDKMLVANELASLLGHGDGLGVRAHLPIAAAVAEGNSRNVLQFNGPPPPDQIQLPGGRTAPQHPQRPARLRTTWEVPMTAVGPAPTLYAMDLLPSGLNSRNASSRAPGPGSAPAVAGEVRGLPKPMAKPNARR